MKTVDIEKFFLSFIYIFTSYILDSNPFSSHPEICIKKKHLKITNLTFPKELIKSVHYLKISSYDNKQTLKNKVFIL